MPQTRLRRGMYAVVAAGLVTVLAGCAHAPTGETGAATLVTSPVPTMPFASASSLQPLLGVGNAAGDPSATAVAVRPAHPSAGQMLDVRVKVTVYGTTGTGAVVVLDGGSALRTVPLAWTGDTGTAQLSVLLPAGTHRILARYGGDAHHAGSTSPAVTVAVARVASQLAVTATPVPKTKDKFRLGVAVRTHTKNVLGAGSVTLVVGGVTYVLALDSTGHAHVNFAATHGVRYVVIASYGGDANLTPASASTVFIG